MTEIKPLQMFQNENGEPGERIQDDVFDLGYFDSSLGKEFTFFLYNGNHNVLVEISDLHSENDNCTFQGPDMILPMETVKCTWKVRAKTDEELENIPVFHEDTTKDKICGAITYQPVEVIMEGKSRPWGWKKNA